MPKRTEPPDDELEPEDDLPAEEPADTDEIEVPSFFDRHGKPAKFPVAVDDKATLYITLPSICDFLEVDTRSQRRRAQVHPVIKRHIRKFYMVGPGGRQPTICLEVRLIGYYAGSINASLVRSDLQEFIIEFQEALIDAAYDLLLSMAIKRAAQYGDVTEITLEWARAVERRLGAQQHDIDRLFFMLNTLRQEHRSVPAAPLPPGSRPNLGPLPPTRPK